MLVKLIMDYSHPSSLTALRASTLLLISIIAFFYISYYIVSRSLLKNQKWAIIATFTAFFMNFYTLRPLWAPSVWPARFPLLMIFIITGAWAIKTCRPLAVLLLAAITGASIFLNTETGIYMAICACISFTTCFFRLRWKKFALVFGGYGLVALITFQALATLAFGFGVWRTPFYRGLIDPLLVYGGGFGAWTVNWSFGFQILFNFVVPLSMAVLAGYSTKVLLLTKNLYLDVEYIYFQLTSFLWLCLSFKWVNMSLDAVWFSSAQLVIFLAARLGKELELKLRGPFDALGKCIPYAALTSILTFFYFYQDVRMPTVYGVKSFWNYPSLFKEVLTESKQTVAETTIHEISDEDISLIKMNTAQQERVCLISYYDWIYLTQAQRASVFIFSAKHHDALC